MAVLKGDSKVLLEVFSKIAQVIIEMRALLLAESYVINYLAIVILRKVKIIMKH